MDFRVVITKPAINDLAEIVGYISQDNQAAAGRMGFRLVEMAESLRGMPLRWRIVPERKQCDCREIVSRPYRIVYRVSEEKRWWKFCGSGTARAEHRW